MRRRLFLGALAGAALHGADAIEALEQATVARLRAACERVDGVAGVAAIDLTSGHTLAWNASVVCPSASTIKVPILAAVYRHLDPEQTVPLAPGDLIGSSERLELTLRRGPATVSVRELASAMIEVSDNTATNALIRLVGMERVNALLDEFGLTATRLRRRMLDGAAAKRGDDNTSTPLELARLAQLLHRGKLGPEDMLGFLKRVEADLRRTVPANIEVASKPGDVPGSRSEMGIVYVPKRPFAVGIMSAFLGDGANPIPELAAIVYAHFDRVARSNQFGNRLE
jgi:beta-lactamase class A